MIPDSLAGSWHGVIDLPGAPVRIRVHLDPAGTGSLDVPAQLASGLPVVDVSEDGGVVCFAAAGLPGAPRFTGFRNGTSITGELVQAGQQVRFTLTRGAETPLVRPQTPTRPVPYNEDDIDVEVAGGVRLAGTLTTPPGAGPHPAVVLITGSGALDRDETVADHKPFEILADTLARAGVAALRVDDRGVGGSTGRPGELDYDELADDVVACVQLLRRRARIDPDRVGLIGHSQGGYLAPVAVGRADPGAVAAVVLLTTPALPGLQVLKDQTTAILRAEHLPAADIDARLTHIDTLATHLRSADIDGAVAVSRARALGQPDPTGDHAAADARARAAVQALRPLLDHDPGPALRALTVPTLAVYGGTDLQVAAEHNAPAMRDALTNTPRSTVIVLPGLNHLLQPSDTGSPHHYAHIDTTIADTALHLVTSWLDNHL